MCGGVGLREKSGSDEGERKNYWDYLFVLMDRRFLDREVVQDFRLHR